MFFATVAFISKTDYLKYFISHEESLLFLELYIENTIQNVAETDLHTQNREVPSSCYDFSAQVHLNLRLFHNPKGKRSLSLQFPLFCSAELLHQCTRVYDRIKQL